MTKKKENQEQLSIFNGYTPALLEEGNLNDIFKNISLFQEKCFASPDKNFIEKTPDSRAETLVISYIETKLDELYSGLWSTSNFEYKQIQNEMVGSLLLKVFHPRCGVWIERIGAASIQIMVDKAPDSANKNQWALDINNKKANALYMGFGKLKAECLKNAAKSLGNIFGRDLNRKKSDIDFNSEYFESENENLRTDITPLLVNSSLDIAEIERIKVLLSNKGTSHAKLIQIYNRLSKNQK